MLVARSRLVRTCLVLLLGLLSLPGAALVQAGHSAGDPIFVDDDCSGAGDGTEAAPFCTIQEGIAHANAGETVNVAAGVYVEAGQIVISQDLTISGAGIGDTNVTTNTDTGTGGDQRGWIHVLPGVEFHISDLTLDGTGHLIWQAIRHQGSGSVERVHFTNIKYQVSGSPYAGTGIAAFGTGMVDVSDSMFDEIGRIGLQYFGPGVSGSTASGNTFVGKGPGDWLDYGIEVGAGAQITATNNDIRANRGVASSDGSTSAGILVTTFFGPGTSATLEGNMIADNTTGIAVGYDETDSSLVEAHQNNIVGNATGISTTAPAVSATCNWWGSASGPFDADENPTGTGDSVDGDVEFAPWLTDEAPGAQCNGPILNPETKEDCKHGGWRDYGFRNQGQCIRYVNTGYDSRTE